MSKVFVCNECKQTKDIPDTFGTGYATDKNDNKICYECCGKLDYESLKNAKIGDKFLFYLTKRYWNNSKSIYEKRNIDNEKNSYNHFISNWPGTMNIKCSTAKQSNHNFGCKRIDVWFGNEEIGYWWGVQIGDFNEIVHCKKINKKSYYR